MGIGPNRSFLARQEAPSRAYSSHLGPLSAPGGTQPKERQAVDQNLNVRLTGGADAAARARRELSRLRADLDPPLAETLRLLVTELVSNAVRHTAAETVSLKVLVGRTAVFTEVKDTGAGIRPGDDRAATRRPHGLGPVPRRAARGPLGCGARRPRHCGVVRVAPGLGTSISIGPFIPGQLLLCGRRLA